MSADITNINDVLQPNSQDVFRYLTVEDWQLLLTHCRSLNLTTGDALIQEGDEPVGLFVVKTGRMAVVRQEEGKAVQVAERGMGDILGEMSMVDQRGASASVVALEDSACYFISSAELEKLLIYDFGLAARFYRSLAVNISGRLREASKHLAQLNLPRVLAALEKAKALELDDAQPNVDRLASLLGIRF